MKTSFNHVFGQAQYANFIFSLNRPTVPPSLSSWLGTTHPLFETGAGFNESQAEGYYSFTALRGRFDVLIHFRGTSPTQLLP